MRGVLAIVILVSLTACGGDPEPSVDRRGPFGAPTVATSAPLATSAGPRQHYDLDTLAHDPLDRVPGPSARATTTTTGGAGGSAAAAPEGRNYAGELATAIGSPMSCIDLATARTLHGHVTIQVTANVTPSGGVTRATAAGAGLPPTALTCVQNLALAARLLAPVADAPRVISTSLTFDVSATDDTVTHETPVWHQPGAVAEPGVVLPAVGAQGRPEGSVAPDETMPAIGATGRPEGSVAPDIVLPARGR